MATAASYGLIVKKIMDGLKEHGPMSRTEASAKLGISRDTLSAVFSRLSKPGKETPKRIYIKEWKTEAKHSRPYPRAVYAIGNKPNKPRPKSRTHAEAQAAYRKNLKPVVVTSVFDLGMTRAAHRARRTSITKAKQS